MVKAIITDIDGTLISSQYKIMPKTKEALLTLQKKGIKIVLASGRNNRRLLALSNELEMPKYGGYFIELNGMRFYDVEKRQEVILQRMSLEEVLPLFQYLMTKDCELLACADLIAYSYIPDRLIPIKEKERKEKGLSKDFPWTGGPWGGLFDMRQVYDEIRYIKDVSELNGSFNKIQILEQEENVNRLYEACKAEFGNQFDYFRTSHRQIEILPYGLSKGVTLQKIMELNNWKSDEIVVFGDGENDVSLFEQSEYSFAMGQAREYVKEKARYVTTSNDEEGIYMALKQLNLI